MADPTDAAEVSPPWGSLPAEQFLIRNWDPVSSLTPDEQRRTLIRAFLAMENVPTEWCLKANNGNVSRVPTESEVQFILAPWRPLSLRNVAAYIWQDRPEGLIILRTYYGNDEEAAAKFEEWLDREMGNGGSESEEDNWWRILDDRERFNFPDDQWHRVLDVLPELVGYSGQPRLPNTEVLAKARSMADHLRSFHPNLIDENYYDSLSQENVLDDLVLYEAQQRWLAIANRDSFESENENKVDSFRLLMLDGHGNIVKESDIWPEEIPMLVNSPQRGQFQDSRWWVDGVIGPRYKHDGDIGSALFAAIRNIKSRSPIMGDS
ncbi:hypothetical protein DL771_009839 [Monosporascus sp. 5C6A]|nr:hypothetical protein DL771_009839 [Monosporascus sp. 5C6A]